MRKDFVISISVKIREQIIGFDQIFLRLMFLRSQNQKSSHIQEKSIIHLEFQSSIVKFTPSINYQNPNDQELILNFYIV